MKNTLLFTTLVFISLLYSCSTDDFSFSPTEGTDFTKDISNLRDFTLSTPIELKVLNNKFVNNSLNYVKGDTLKLELSFNAIFQENDSEFYDLRNSTGADNFNYYLDVFSYRLQKVIDLNFLEKHPEIITENLSDIAIRISPIYKALFLNNLKLKATYNAATKKYESKIGIVLSESDVIKNRHLQIPTFITNFNKPKNIGISIPIISVLQDIGKEIVIKDN